MSSLLLRAMKALSLVLATTFVLAVGVAALWFMIDLVASLNHWWVGNPVSVAFANGIEWFIQTTFGLLAIALRFLYAQSIALCMLLGASRHTAEGITISIALVLDLTILYFAVRWASQQEKESLGRMFKHN
jgi:hypothetical protein